MWYYEYGSPGAPAALLGPPADGPNPGSMFGWALGFAGNLYSSACSGFTRCIAVGAPTAEDGARNVRGAAYIGTPSNIGGTPYRVLGANVGDRLGTAFASANLNTDLYPELLIGQGGAWDGITSANYGGFGILLGAPLAPSDPTISLTFSRHFPVLDVDLVSGAPVQTRFGGAIVATPSDPSDPSDPTKFTRLLIGAPGGTLRLRPRRTHAGRLHVLRRATFNY